MRILLLTFYYPPDLCAGSFRMGGLVDQLLSILPEGTRVDVLTSQPNRYAGLRTAAPEQESHGPLSIERLPLPTHSSGMVDQARAFLSFAIGVLKRVRGRKYDLVFATSSRSMTALLGARIASRLGVPLYLDIRDIFLDTIKDVLPGLKGRVLQPIFKAVERYTLNRTTRLNLVSEGFGPYYRDRYPDLVPNFFTNGIDDTFLTEDWGRPVPTGTHPTRVLYAGNIGEGQGLHRVMPELIKLAGNSYRFTVVGDGGRREELAAACPSLEVLAPVPRSELLRLYHESDILFLHLNDYPAFAKVLPSKLFEYAATGRPILAGVSGHSADFLRQHVDNCEIFNPCDARAGMEALARLSLQTNPREKFRAMFSRASIMQRMASTLMLLSHREKASNL